MKLSIYDLNFKGGLVPEDKSAIKDVILDTYNNCVADGAEQLELPVKPVSFTDLVSILKDKGLIKGAGSLPPTPQPSVAATQPQLEQPLLDSYREEVVLSGKC